MNAGADDTIETIPREGELAVSLGQEGWLQLELWHRLLNRPRPPMHCAFSFRLLGPLDAGALEAALNDSLERHESLRTAFVRRRQPVHSAPMPQMFAQVIASAAYVPFEVHDLRALDATACEAECGRLGAECAERPFDYGRPPLLRALLIRTAVAEHVLIVVAHHLVFDGWSSIVLLEELRHGYAARVRGEGATLPEMPVQCADVAAWQRRVLRGERLQRLLDFWTAQWQHWGSHLLDIRTLGETRSVADAGDVGVSYQIASVAPAATAAVRACAAASRATLYELCLAAWYVLLHRRTGAARLATWTHFANRDRWELESQIGWYSTAHVVGVDLSEDPTLAEVVVAVRGSLAAARPHQELPVAVLRAASGASRRANGVDEVSYASFDVMRERRFTAAGLTIVPTVALRTTGEDNLRFWVLDRPAELEVLVRYPRIRLTGDEVRAMLADYVHLLGDVRNLMSVRVSAMSPDRNGFHTRRNGLSIVNARPLSLDSPPSPSQ